MRFDQGRRLVVLSFGAAVWSAHGLRADILLPGSKFVSHKMKFENLKAFEKEYKFFFLPLNQEKGPDWLKAQDEFGQSGVVGVSGISPVRVAQAKGLYLVAVPRSMLDADGGVAIETLLDPPAGVLKSERLVSQIRAVRKEDKVEFWTIYQVTIKDGKLQTGLIRHDEPRRRDQVKTNAIGTGGTALLSAIVAAGALAARLRGRSNNE